MLFVGVYSLLSCRLIGLRPRQIKSLGLIDFLVDLEDLLLGGVFVFWEENSDDGVDLASLFVPMSSS